MSAGWSTSPAAGNSRAEGGLCELFLCACVCVRGKALELMKVMTASFRAEGDSGHLGGSCVRKQASSTIDKKLLSAAGYRLFLFLYLSVCFFAKSIVNAHNQEAPRRRHNMLLVFVSHRVFSNLTSQCLNGSEWHARRRKNIFIRRSCKASSSER